jgi:hypothetical protein
VGPAEFKNPNKIQTLLQLDPFQTLASKLRKNSGKFLATGFDVLDNFCYWSFLKFEMEFELKIR